MHYEPPLLQGTLIRRYQRFFADITTAEGGVMTIHCPNTGAMTGCADPGHMVWYQMSTNPKRKLAATWELATTSDDHWILINTQRANVVAGEALSSGLIPELAGDSVWREVPSGDSRLDFGLGDHRDNLHTYIEVKSVTLHAGNGLGLFPDAVTARGRKHLLHLAELARQGKRAVLLLVVGHSAIDRVAPAAAIDPAYAVAWEAAHAAGVEFLAWRVQHSPANIRLVAPVTVCHR